jgi:hypothetical protein
VFAHRGRDQLTWNELMQQDYPASSTEPVCSRPVDAMTTDFRAICAELEDAYTWCIEEYMTAPAKEDTLIQRARAALAQPEPEPVRPTDEELLRVAASAIEPYESSGIALGEYEPETECAVEVYSSELISFARAVLAKWGANAQ